MITVKSESFMAALPELKPLLDLHYEELALNKDKVPLDPCYDLYELQEARGYLLFMAMRDEGKLIGYYIGFVQPGLHYRTCLTCVTDIFFIVPGQRGNALLGIRLFRAVEEELRTRGVQRWLVGSKLKADTSAIFQRLKFDPIETYYSKWLGE